MPTDKPKPVFTLVNNPTFEDLLQMFEALTGRKPTDEEMEEARREMEGWNLPADDQLPEDKR